MKSHLLGFIAHLLFALSMIFGGHALKNYYVLSNAVVPNIEALAPTDGAPLNEIVHSALPGGETGQRAREVLKLRGDEAAMLHRSWLHQAAAHEQLAAVQAGAWSVVLVAALYLMYSLRRNRGAHGAA